MGTQSKYSGYEKVLASVAAFVVNNNVFQIGANQKLIRSRRRHAVKRWTSQHGKSRYKPHQSKKECARRIRQGRAPFEYDQEVNLHAAYLNRGGRNK